MKIVKWKILIITCLISLLPVLLGVMVWDKLPDMMAVHFDLNNNADNFAPKTFAVFGLPCIMAFLQCFGCIVSDFNAKKYGQENVEIATKWIIPVVSIVLQIATIGIGMGLNLDIRKIAALLIGVIFLLTGICLPKLNYVKNYNLEIEKAKKINRFLGIETKIMGLLFMVSVLLPPLSTFICILLLIPCGIIGAIYGIKVGRR